MQKYELTVAGGGLTGVAAAVAAAREGMNVLLVERYGFLGGAATNSQVNPFAPTMVKKIANGNGKSFSINKGIFELIQNRLEKMGGLTVRKTTFNEEILKIVLDALITEYNVSVLFHSYITSVEKTGNHIDSITIANKSGNEKIYSDYFIDCTGDADVAALAGCPNHLGRSEDGLCQPMTLCFRIGNIALNKNTPEFSDVMKQVNDLYKKFRLSGKIKNPRENVLVFDHMCNGVIHFNSTRIVRRNPIDSHDVSIAEIEARQQMWELYSFLKENIPQFKNSVLLTSGAQIGVRESRMIDGAYTITVEDILSCKKFDDAIACGNYSVDIHSPDGTGTVMRHIPDGDYYTIPYRALLPKGINNLLVAGRCISSTHEAQSAYRVMPICCCMGEAAGAAASIAAKGGTAMKNVDIKEVQHIIEHHGGRCK